MNKYFKNKTLLITGGTGSFGNAILRRFINFEFKEIRIFSRDEKKQDDMRRKFSDDRIKFIIGDVRELKSLEIATKNVDFIFHAAALKQVPSCEFHPIEAIKTNVYGTENLLDAAIKNNVKKVICLSTDKAVYPINAMGMSKALMEKVVIAKSQISEKTQICITRYGNVMGSRGSVVPLFIDQILNNNSITITDPTMTRFMMTLDDAINLVLYAFLKGKTGEIFIQKSPATDILTLAKSIMDLMHSKNHKIVNIGARHGEKQHETLMNREEREVSKEKNGFFIIPPDKRNLNYSKFFDKGKKSLANLQDYNSHNAERLSLIKTKKMLLKLNFFKKENIRKDSI